MSVGAVFGIVGGALSARQTIRRYAYTLLDKMTAFLGYVVLFLFFFNVLQLSDGTVTQDNYVSFGSLLSTLGEFSIDYDAADTQELPQLFNMLEGLRDTPVVGDVLYFFGSIGNAIFDFLVVIVEALRYILVIFAWVFSNLLPAIFA